MDIEKQIEHLKTCARLGDSPIMDGFAVIADKRKLEDAATALSTLQAENEKLRAELEQARESLDFARTKDAEIVRLGRKLEQVKRERDAAKSPEVLEAVDELMEFSRTRMSIGGWICYVNAFGEWRGPQKED